VSEIDVEQLEVYSSLVRNRNIDVAELNIVINMARGWFIVKIAS